MKFSSYNRFVTRDVPNPSPSSRARRGPGREGGRSRTRSGRTGECQEAVAHATANPHQAGRHPLPTSDAPVGSVPPLFLPCPLPPGCARLRGWRTLAQQKHPSGSSLPGLGQGLLEVFISASVWATEGEQPSGHQGEGRGWERYTEHRLETRGSNTAAPPPCFATSTPPPLQKRLPLPPTWPSLKAKWIENKKITVWKCLTKINSRV